MTKLRLTLYNRITTVSNLINLMRQNSTIKILWKDNKVYGESEIAALDRRYKLHQPRNLKVQSCKLHNNKYMIASTQITNTKIFASIAVLVFKLLSRKFLFINRKEKRNCK